MTKPAENKLKAVLLQFLENPKGIEPDVKALARLLRGNAPLPKGFRNMLAEILDSQMQACNWQLGPPDYVGWREKRAVRDKREKEIDDALATEPNITQAIAAIDSRKASERAMSGRTAFSVWTEMQDRRAWWEKMLEASPLTDSQKETVRRIWRTWRP